MTTISQTPLGRTPLGPTPLGTTPLDLKSSLYHYTAHVTKVYDGDTITVDIDLGLGICRRGQSIRLWKINTPEVRGAAREEGLAVRDFVRDLVLDKTILLRTILDKRGQDSTGKFGRLLGEVLVEQADGTMLNINDLLLQQGMAVGMDERGSVVRGDADVSFSSPNGQSTPAVVPCPYCGEQRAVDAATHLVQICPNCLDGAFLWGEV